MITDPMIRVIEKWDRELGVGSYYFHLPHPPTPLLCLLLQEVKIKLQLWETLRQCRVYPDNLAKL